MTIQETIIGRIVTLKVSGRIASGPDVAPLKARIQTLAKQDVCQVVIDLSEIAWIGSAMLGVLAHGFVITRAGDGDLRLVGVNKQIASALRVTKLDTVFQVENRQSEPSGHIASLPVGEQNCEVLKVA